MPFDYLGALNEGYSDEEIVDYLSPEAEFDTQGALGEGYSTGEIARHLAGVDETEWQNQLNPRPEMGVEPEADTTAMGLLGSTARGAVEGLTTGIPEMAGGAAQFLGDKTGFDALENTGRDIKEWSQEKAEDWFGEQPQRSALENIAYEGSKMLAPSIIPGMAGAIAFRGILGVGRVANAARVAAIAAEASGAAEDIALASSLAGKAAKLASAANTAGAATNAVAMFGLSQAQQTIDNAENTARRLEAKGDFEGAEKARAAGQGVAPYVTGAIEAAGEYFGTKYLGKLFGLDEAQIVKRGAKELATDFLRTLGVEVGTEVGQAAGQGAIEKAAGIRPEADILEDTIQVIGPTAFMTLLTGGLAAGANVAKRGDRDRTIDDVEKEIDSTAPLSTENDAANDEYIDRVLAGEDAEEARPTADEMDAVRQEMADRREAEELAAPQMQNRGGQRRFDPVAQQEESPETEPSFTPEQLQSVGVKVRGLDAETGEVVEMNERADNALKDIEAQSETYYSILECVG